MLVGFIGVGVVGGAIARAFEEKTPVVKYDINGKYNTFEEVLDASVIFVCVPTPTTNNEQDLTAVHDVFHQLTEAAYKGIVVLKSTVVPKTCETLQSLFPFLKLAHNPEFLTERNAYVDYVTQSVVVMSAKDESTHEVLRQLHKTVLPTSEYHPCYEFVETEMCKYIHNCFLATKVAFMNEIYNLCQIMGTNYENAMNAARTQGKIGHSHLAVPGPDGRLGYGGMCFPKDTQALATYAEKLVSESPLTILQAVINSNAKQRQ